MAYTPSLSLAYTEPSSNFRAKSAISSVQGIPIDSSSTDRIINSLLEIAVKEKKIGQLPLLPFLKALYAKLEKKIGKPLRFELVGGALAAMVEGVFVYQDIDIVIEYPPEMKNHLKRCKDIFQEVIAGFIPNCPKDPFFRKSLPDTEEFKAAILSMGDEENSWVDFTIVTTQTRRYLFRYHNIYANLVPYITSEAPLVLESLEMDPRIPLEDRRKKVIVIEQPEEINHMGWPSLLLLLAKGYRLDSAEAEPILKKTFLGYVKKGLEGALSILNRTFDNHGVGKSKGKYYLSAFLSLLDLSTPKELQYMAKEATHKKKFDSVFLNYVANNCLSNTERKSQLIPLAYLLDLTSFPSPSSQEWLQFLKELKKASWVEEQFQEWLSSPLYEIAFQKILSSDYPSIYNKKKSLDALYTSLEEAELKTVLARRLDFEFQMSPDLALQTYQKHRTLLAEETRLAFITGLHAKKKTNYVHALLEIEYKFHPNSFPIFLAKFSHEKIAIPFLLEKIVEVKTQEEAFLLLPSIELFKKNGLISDKIKEKAPEFASAILEPSTKEPSEIVTCLLLLLPYLSLETNQKAVLWVENHLFPLKVHRMKEVDRENLLIGWPLLWPALSETNRKALIHALLTLGLTLKESHLEFFIDDKNPTSSELLLTLLTKGNPELPVRRIFYTKIITRLESEGKLAEAKKIYEERCHLFKNEQEKAQLYNLLAPFSEIKNPLYLTLSSPPKEDFEWIVKGVIERTAWPELLLLLPKGIALGIAEEPLQSALSKIEGFDFEKFKLLSQHPRLITPKLLDGLSLKKLTHDSLSLLFKILVDRKENHLTFLKKVCDKIAPETIIDCLPAIIEKIPPSQKTLLLRETAFWVKKIPLSKWNCASSKNRSTLLFFFENHPQFLEEEIALLLSENSEPSILKALPKISDTLPRFLELSVLFLEKIELISPENQKRLAPFFAFCENNSSFKESCKKALSEATSPYYICHYISLLLIEEAFLEKDIKKAISGFKNLIHLNAHKELHEIFFERTKGKKIITEFPEVIPIFTQAIEMLLDHWVNCENRSFELESKIIEEYLRPIFLCQKSVHWNLKQIEKYLTIFESYLSNPKITIPVHKVYTFISTTSFATVSGAEDFAPPPPENQYSIWLALTKEAKNTPSMNIILASLFKMIDKLIEKIPENDKKIGLIEFTLLSNSSDNIENIYKHFQILIDFYNSNPKLTATVLFDIYNKIVQEQESKSPSKELATCLNQALELIINRSLSPKQNKVKWLSIYNTIIKIIKEKHFSEVSEKFFKHFLFRKDSFKDADEASEHLSRIGNIVLLLDQQNHIGFKEAENYVCLTYIASQLSVFIEKMLPHLLNQIPKISSESPDVVIAKGTTKVLSYISEIKSPPYYSLGIQIFDFLLKNRFNLSLEPSCHIAIEMLATREEWPFEQKKEIERLLYTNTLALINNPQQDRRLIFQQTIIYTTFLFKSLFYGTVFFEEDRYLTRKICSLWADGFMKEWDHDAILRFMTSYQGSLAKHIDLSLLLKEDPLLSVIHYIGSCSTLTPRSRLMLNGAMHQWVGMMAAKNNVNPQILLTQYLESNKSLASIVLQWR